MVEGKFVVPEAFQYGFVVIRTNDDGNSIVIFRGRANHRGTADIDIFDGVINARIVACDGFFERVQVDDEQVDRFDAVLGHHGFVRAAATEQAAVDDRVQRLHATVHDLRKARLFRHFDHTEAGVSQLTAGTTG